MTHCNPRRALLFCSRSFILMMAWSGRRSTLKGSGNSARGETPWSTGDEKTWTLKGSRKSVAQPLQG
jgi:hypothetical protein